ncbi:curli production assembly/transport component CsgG [Reichenbachiella agariperforans]|uniref:Curli production assembly/transport component CsgG n=1 Tax=Reichenbachiella agariperforans TaxID=156994 RepID=A0A1M6LEG0_REIAG|nr:CsgG/HfaB family protein [Reichenbachiella agariperforans]SHJ69557.1 curli production assembly/transport component CsgG [Reichenbachiella agariperforans]
MINRLIIYGIVATMASCAPLVHQPVKVTQAEQGEESARYQHLTSLPVPKEKIVAAVYKFRDQTGQYKMSEVGSNWSTAVTQGATSILIRTMEESGWFVPIEREGLPNLLNERKIIRSSRATYGNQDTQGDLLPPLLYAGVLLEGGIISFDSNVLTGGIGARYLGMSSSGQYREDRVTVYLRAVSTINGKILKTIYTSKTILSQKVDIGVFKFVAPQKLLEAETGFTYNEPAEMAVREAIEQSVIGLIVEGIEEGIWEAESTEFVDNTTVSEYNQSKWSVQRRDQFGSITKERRSNFGMSIGAGGNQMYGDYYKREVKPNAYFGLQFFSTNPVSIGIDSYYGQLGISEAYEFYALTNSTSITYRMLNGYRATPYLKVGIGATTNMTDDYSMQFQVTGNFGIEYMLSDHIGLFGQYSYINLFGDSFDNIEQGKYNDYIMGGHIGLNFYLTQRREKINRRNRSSKSESYKR